MKHTPAPWSINSDGNITNEFGETIAVAYNLEDGESYNANEETKANRNLISAAPELLESLKAVLVMNPVTNSTTNKAWEIIKKATE